MSQLRNTSYRMSMRRGAVLASAVALLCGSGWAWNASGTVKNSSGKAVAGVSVSVQDSAASLATVTDESGKFTIRHSTGVSGSRSVSSLSIERDGRELVVRYPGEGTLEFTLFDLGGSRLWMAQAFLNQGVARALVPASVRVTTGVLQVKRHGEVIARTAVFQGLDGLRIAPQPVAARSLASGFATLVFRKSGYKTTSHAMAAESASDLAIVMTDSGAVSDSFVEDHRGECTMPSFPAASGLTANAKLPNPFKMYDGTAITSPSQVKCKREEVLAMMEKYVMGEKPRKPEKVTGSMSGNKLTVSVTDKGKTVSFQVTITKPSGTGPFAAIIGLEGGNLGSSYSSLPVATISYPAMTSIATEGSGRGKGVFYDLYGSSASAGELMAWAWGVSRVIDALAATPDAGIDVRKLAVTGCSRLGKGAFVVGVMDQRIALVIPQESGTGGLASWRMVSATSGAQPVANAAGEQYWMRADFSGNFGNATGKLPFDNHEVAGYVAPRAFLFFDNSIDWLGPTPGYGTANAAKEVYKAMGVPEAFTYSSVGGHDHCSLPSTQHHWVQSYMKKYLLGQTGEADKIEGPYSFDKAKWIDWTTPTLK